MTTQKNTDPEAWLADQLAQLPVAHTEFGDSIVYWEPGEGAFEDVQKIAQEYGEMCTARATETICEEIG